MPVIALMVTVGNIVMVISNIFLVVHVQTKYGDFEQLIIDSSFIYDKCLKVLSRLERAEAEEVEEGD